MSASKKPTTVEEIIENTIKAIESCKRDLTDISLYTQQDSDDIKIRLMEIKQEVMDIINVVEDLEKKEKHARIRLLTVSKNLKDYSEAHIKDAYEKANELQVKLRLLKSKEKDLIALRTELEYKLVKNREKLQKAEQANMQISIALEYLKIDIEDEKTENPRENLGAKVIIAQEKERMRVAREIHDGPAQALANVIIRAEYCERLFDKNIEEARMELRKLKEQIRADLKDIRKIIYNLRPMTLDDLGLVPTVRRMIDELNERQDEVKISFNTVNLSERLPSTIEVAVFRIIQEALNNVFKHSGSKHTDVKIEKKDRLVTIEIKDDGMGFEFNKDDLGKDAEGYGLLGMIERVDLIGGEIDIVSAKGQGTKIKVELSLQGGKG
jgi:two-component system sensor histidine kinase DegS